MSQPLYDTYPPIPEPQYDATGPGLYPRPAVAPLPPAPPRGPRAGAIVAIVLAILLAAGLIAAVIAASGDDSSSSAPSESPSAPVAALPGGASSPTTQSSRWGELEQAYLDNLDDGGIEYSTEAAAVNVGYGICDALDEGYDVYDVGAIAMEAGYSAGDAGWIIGSAVAAFCPRYGSQLG
jgi:hypothetical protein